MDTIAGTNLSGVGNLRAENAGADRTEAYPGRTPPRSAMRNNATFA